MLLATDGLAEVTVSKQKYDTHLQNKHSRFSSPFGSFSSKKVQTSRADPDRPLALLRRTGDGGNGDTWGPARGDPRCRRR